MPQERILVPPEPTFVSSPDRPEAARAAHCKTPRARTGLRKTLCIGIGFYEDTDTCIGVPHFLAMRYLPRTVFNLFPFVFRLRPALFGAVLQIGL